MALVASQLLALPALAAPRAADLSDDHLYLRQEEEHWSVLHLGRRRHWGWRMPYVTHFVGHRTFITKGELPISNERFISLITQSKAAPYFTEGVAAKQTARNQWGLATLGSFGVLGLGLGLTANDPFYRDPLAAPSTYTAVANGLTIAGVVSSLITSWVWMDKVSRPLFTTEEAAEAIKDYNRQLDQLQISH
ncbi:hypothetical protein D3C86_1064880 [compost metagenome]